MFCLFFLFQSIRDKAEDVFVSLIGKTWISEANPDLQEKIAPPPSRLLPLRFLKHLLHHNKSKSDAATVKGLFLAQRFVRSSVLLLPHLLDAPFQKLTPEENLLLTDVVSFIASSTRDSDFLRPADRKVFVADVVDVLKSVVAGTKFAANNHQVKAGGMG